MSGGSRPVNMRTDAGMGEVKRAPGASRMLEWDERMHRWAVVGEAPVGERGGPSEQRDLAVGGYSRSDRDRVRCRKHDSPGLMRSSGPTLIA